jgi:hypothetical protein
MAQLHNLLPSESRAPVNGLPVRRTAVPPRRTLIISYSLDRVHTLQRRCGCWQAQTAEIAVSR